MKDAVTLLKPLATIAAVILTHRLDNVRKLIFDFAKIQTTQHKHDAYYTISTLLPKLSQSIAFPAMLLETNQSIRQGIDCHRQRTQVCSIGFR